MKNPNCEPEGSGKGLQRNNVRFRAAFDSAPDAIFLLDAEGRVVLVNQTAETMLGYSRDEVVGQPVEMLVSGNLRATYEDQCALESVHPVPRAISVLTDMYARHKSGACIPVSISLSQIKLDHQREFIAVVRDITTTKEMENLLRRHSQEFQALVDNAPDVIARFDREQRFLYANPAIEPAFGIEHTECLGRTWGELGFPEPWQNSVREVFEHGKAVMVECSMDLAPAGLRHFHVRMVPERDLESRVVSVLVIARDISERKRHEDELLYQACHDALTGLPNRSLILERLQRAIFHVKRNQSLLAVAYLDLDHLKDINDTMGHSVGDELLRQAASRINGVLRQGDTVGRQGGDEFILLLPDITHMDDVTVVAEKILATLARPFILGGRELYVTGSLGLSICPSDGEDAESLLRNADVAMYRVKEEGRNAFRFYGPEMDARTRARVEIEHDLRLAIKQEELVLHYQPRVSLVSGAVQGFEALVRWNHPDKGLIGPARFIGVAEDTGLIIPLGYWVLLESCRRARQWQDMGYSGMRISVNLSARQFRDPGLVERVKWVLSETRLDPAFLELEITESTVMYDSEVAISTLRSLKRLGITLSVDDFGTGYSSLSYLKLFPIDVLKVDRSFVSNITTDSNDAAIVRAIVTLAHSLGLVVVAEGAEEAAQVDFLRLVKCDELQGFYFSRPLSDVDAEFLLRSDRKLNIGELRHKQQNPTLLIVDGEYGMRDALKHKLRGENWQILEAGDASEALNVLVTHGAQVVLCSQDMHDMASIRFLDRIRQVFPDIACVAYTSRNNVESIGNAAVLGDVCSTSYKHWDSDELIDSIRAAFDTDAQKTRYCDEILACGGKLACHDLECRRRMQ